MTQVVVMAGGANRRFGTDEPKALAMLAGETLLERCINLFRSDHRASDYAFKFILGYKAQSVASYIDSMGIAAGVEVELTDAGKGRALQNALETGVIDRNRRSIIVFPDDVYLMANLPSFVLTHHEFALRLGTTASCALVPGYEWPFGAPEVDDDGIVFSFAEKPFVARPSATGFYVLEPQVYDLLLANRNDYFDFEREVLPYLAGNGKLNGVTLPAGSWIPINTQVEYERAKRMLSGAALPPQEPRPWPE